MPTESYGREFWERRWVQVLQEHPDIVGGRPPSPHLLAAVADLPPGRALDAGCGHGAEAIWLAVSGWEVTGVDFSTAALEHARVTGEALGPEVDRRLRWVEADLATWAPQAGCFDLVSCLYVHVAGSVPEFVTRLGAGVAPGGTLLLVGHLPTDPATGEPTPAAGQVQVTVEDAVASLDPEQWRVVVAEERQRVAAGTGVDAVVRAERRW